jgi:hypothetical protein
MSSTRVAVLMPPALRGSFEVLRHGSREEALNAAQWLVAQLDRGEAPAELTIVVALAMARRFAGEVWTEDIVQQLGCIESELLAVLLDQAASAPRVSRRELGVLATILAGPAHARRAHSVCLRRRLDRARARQSR